LRGALARVSKAYGEIVFVDRRVDPRQRVTLHVDSATLGELLESLAASHTLGTSRLGQLRYLGPRAAAEKLRTVAAIRGDDVAKLPQALQPSLERTQQVGWPRLTEPRGLITSLMQLRGWRIAQAERIPHDLWPAGTLPPLSGVEQLTVLLIGFDLTFTVNAATRTLEIVPLGTVTIERRYPLASRQRGEADLLLQEFPTDVVRVDGSSVVVVGRVEDHERVRELLSERPSQPRDEPSPSPAKSPSSPTNQVYTLRVQEQQVGVILQQLAERLKWAIEIDDASIRAAGLTLDVRITFAVENSSQDELLEAVLRPAGLDYRKDGATIRIIPREQDR
jgi:hypothetical protein